MFKSAVNWPWLLVITRKFLLRVTECWTKVMVEMQMCSWLTSLYCDIWCSKVYFPPFLHFFPRQAVISDNATINMRGICHKSKHFVFIHRNQNTVANVRAPTSDAHNQSVGWRYRSLILIITIFGRSLSDCVYLVPREIDHILMRNTPECFIGSAIGCQMLTPTL